VLNIITCSRTGRQADREGRSAQARTAFAQSWHKNNSSKFQVESNSVALWLMLLRVRSSSMHARANGYWS
jgi:hypothetical protein